MFRSVLLSTAALVAGSAMVVNAAAQDDVKAASQKLAEATGYSWTQTVENSGNNRGGGPLEGKTERNGYTVLSMSRQNNTTHIVLKGDKVAVETPDGWESLEELQADNGGGAGNGQRGGPGRFIGGMVRNMKLPAVQAEEMAGKVEKLTEADGAISGDLSEDAAKQMLSFRRPPRANANGNGNANAGNGGGPQISNAKGDIKFWVKDGVLTKYAVHVQGTMSRNGNDVDIDRTTTVEIKDVGSTKIEVPDEAKKKLESAPAPT
jgi:hypothetical protein